ncbi:MAG: RluA family pseudouridine synthase [Desulfomonile tiedjei]|nr:RluA family pseudouridine synthase [Desulfomonile tiedjei]
MDLPSSIDVPEGFGPDRADKLLAEVLPAKPSRSSLARMMREGLVIVAGRPISPSTVLNPGDRVEFLRADVSLIAPAGAEIPEVPIIFEDDGVIVVDKPPGLAVHPGAGRSTGTLMDVLVRTRPEMIGVGEPDRWGIVHRLDRDTSGVMVAAKTAHAHAELSAQFRQHSVHRIYLAIVRGNPSEDEGVIDVPLGRHAKDRKRISTVTKKARSAITRWKVLERLGELTLLEIRPETGRTHQIRVHLASRGMPVAGDPVYGKARKKTAAGTNQLKAALAHLKRQALHAAVLGFIHPINAQYVEFSSPLPEDMARVIATCK